MSRLSPIAALLLLVLAAPASAQEAVVEGPGVKINESTIMHPSFGVATGLITNMFYENSGGEMTGVLRLMGDVEFGPLVPDAQPDELAGTRELSGQGKIDLRGGVSLTYEEYLSGNDNVRAQRNLGVSADLAFAAFPQGKVSFYAKDKFQRAIRPTNFESSDSINRDINHLDLGFKFAPGGGALGFLARYENRAEFFEDEDQRFANRMQHSIGAGASWQFLPVTKFWFDASYGFYGGLGSASEGYKNSSRPLNLQLGAGTLITPKSTIRAHAGFLWSNYEAPGVDYMGPTFGAEFGYRYTPLGRALVAYSFTMQDSINADYYLEHMAKMALAHQIANVVAGAEGEVHFRNYRGIPPVVMPITTGDRNDVIFLARANANYVVRHWLAIFAEYIVVSDQTDFLYMVAPGENDDPSYVRQEIFVGARGAI